MAAKKKWITEVIVARGLPSRVHTQHRINYETTPAERRHALLSMIVAAKRLAENYQLAPLLREMLEATIKDMDWQVAKPQEKT